MPIEIVFETHALSEDNERGIATGWLPGRRCEQGRANAADMGRRRRDSGIDAVFTSDLRRAAETAEIAFGDTGIPILYDWRLRECDFGTRNGSPGGVGVVGGDGGRLWLMPGRPKFDSPSGVAVLPSCHGYWRDEVPRDGPASRPRPAAMAPVGPGSGAYGCGAVGGRVFLGWLLRRWVRVCRRGPGPAVRGSRGTHP
ncbi:histidine phosphatase family protein [Actinoplanes sp. NEAU-A12]|uniref:Histidine phosphatase family protein n=1 Tax=Actinoplanes sandaracinus TaxID=3045177 RepID=A0ABT6WZT6_9ACTN|nr:histidine phosphatase family protein [Actinoplanes sandaracinus]MDI6105111.1 histidine phosphatase family protein [Actinoplanes sandaracinus]